MLDSQKEHLAIEQARCLSVRKSRQAKRYLEFNEVLKLKRDRIVQYELAQQAKHKELAYQLLTQQNKTLSEIGDDLHLTKSAVIDLLFKQT